MLTPRGAYRFPLLVLACSLLGCERGHGGPGVQPPGSEETGGLACLGDADPDRSMRFGDIIARLSAQGCLDEADIAAAEAAVADFFASGDVWCDGVWRVSSADGFDFDGAPELVREHASVPDVAITAGGLQVLAFNDLTPGLFGQALRSDPSRFWREGLVGVGGIGMLVLEGTSWQARAVDLQLETPALVVDPDLGLMPTGWRLTTFQVDATTLDGETWDPYLLAEPHLFTRAVSADPALFPAPTEVVSSDVGLHGGVDPTVLDVSGGEILFAGDFVEPMFGWSAPACVYPELGSLPDVTTRFVAGAPDAVVDPDGGYRIYYNDTESGEIRVATSTDGRTWAEAGTVYRQPGAGNPSVARSPDGTWWLYYTRVDETCAGSGPEE